MTVPNATTFLLATPVYASVKYAGEEVWDVLDLLFYNGTYDSYCTKCNRESTFQMHAQTRPAHYTRNLRKETIERNMGVKVYPPALNPGIHHIQASCTRVAHHKQDFVFFVEIETAEQDYEIQRLGTIQKIGQHPSYGDLHIMQVKKYKHVLSQALLGELTRAIGLASHDVGVGAYVYLRRIFETLVDEAHQTAAADDDWDEVQFQRGRMSEKIGLLKAHLPAFLVEQAAMYSVLSKGIHELTEEECLKHFDSLRIGIELILDERLETKQRAQKIADARAAIQKAVGDAKGVIK